MARTILQPMLDEAPLVAKTCAPSSLNNKKADNKGTVRMECVATIHFLRNTGWEKVIDACLQHTSVEQHLVVGKSWESVCKTRWGNLQACVCWPYVGPGSLEVTSGGFEEIKEPWALPTMSSSGANFCGCIFASTFFFAKKWRKTSEFSCFAMTVIHRRLTSMMRNNEGLSLRLGRLGVQVVAHNHGIDDIWRCVAPMHPKVHGVRKGPSLYKGK